MKLQKAKESVEEYFNTFDPSLKGKVKKEVMSAGRAVQKELMYFWLLLIMVLIFGPSAFLLAFCLGIFRHNLDKKEVKSEILIEKKDRSINELYQAMRKRIQHYEDILKIRQDRLSVLEDNTSKDSNLLVIANDYLEMFLNDRITVQDIPVDIQNVMVVMLQTELRTSGSLEELLKLVQAKKNEDLVMRKRKPKNS